ncbi:MAG: twin-arginine translocase subunit TatC, partial [Actinobacteria bacterium]|nr:twin-arginine translocase subunit TatC [Actinomycetota bacterium]
NWVWKMLSLPLEQLGKEGRKALIQYTDVSSGFDTRVQIALFFGVLIASPVWLYQIWAFIVPGLKRAEKWYAIGFLGTAVPLFLAGVYVGWTILPNIVRVMASFQAEGAAFNMEARTYLDFTVKLLVAVGVGFVMPVFLVLLNFIGVLRGMSILKSWRLAIIIIIVFAAIATPTMEWVSMLVLSVPIIVLYFAAAGIAILHDRRVDKRRAGELAEYGIDQSAEPDSESV